MLCALKALLEHGVVFIVVRDRLAEPGEEYLVLQSDGGQPFTMTLDPGTYAVEWFGVDHRETAGADQTTVTEGSARFTPPFSRVRRSCT